MIPHLIFCILLRLTFFNKPIKNIKNKYANEKITDPKTAPVTPAIFTAQKERKHPNRDNTIPLGTNLSIKIKPAALNNKVGLLKINHLIELDMENNVILINN